MSSEQNHTDCPNCRARREAILNTFDFNMREAFKDEPTEKLEFIYEQLEKKRQNNRGPINQLTVGNSVYGKPQNFQPHEPNNPLDLKLTVGNSVFGKKQGEI